MGIRSPSGYLKGSIATIGEGAYGLCLNVVGNVYGVITNGFGNKPDRSDVWWFLWDCDQFGVFHTADDRTHGLDDLNGIFSNRCFSGEHHGICSVHDRIGNIVYLCPCCGEAVNHTFHHLCCNDDGNSRFFGAFHQFFLNQWNLSRRYFNTQVTSGNHQTIAIRNDFVDVVNSLRFFNFCNDWDFMVGVFFD